VGGIKDPGQRHHNHLANSATNARGTMRRVWPNSERRNRLTGEAYATADDLQKYFADEMTELFRLAFLLIADVEEAERCVILAMRECMSAGWVLKEELHIWIRRIVVRIGIEMVTGHQNDSSRNREEDEPGMSISDPMGTAVSAYENSAGILTLDDNERLVCVLSVVEHYPMKECARLLGRSIKEVREARRSALERIAVFEREARRITGTPTEDTSWPTAIAPGADFDFSCGTVID
jgi:DNA-directed RNA polymerase specialized sigma24 family protein